MESKYDKLSIEYRKKLNEIELLKQNPKRKKVEAGSTIGKYFFCLCVYYQNSNIASYQTYKVHVRSGIFMSKQMNS